MRILVVEDDKNIRDLLKTGLESEAFIVDAVGDGEKGSFVARTNEYDVIILDNMLPRKEGFQVCKEIRAIGKTTPIIMLSMRGDVPKKVELLNSGADDYITKPFSFEELVARIRSVMRRPHIIEHSILAIDDLTINITTQEVCRKEKEVYLTRKEYSLLEYLLRNKGKIVSRGMIMEHVWNMDSDPYSNTIEVHVLNLRKKIDAGPSQKLIHNVPGRGYKLDTVA